MKKTTILITTRNEEKTGVLEKSIRACLEQEYPKNCYEILVIDDASTDKTVEIIRKYGPRIRCIKNKTRLGRVKCLNKGIRLVRTPYFVDFNADCVPEKTWLKSLMRGFTSPKIAVVKSSQGIGEGISAAYRKSVIMELGLFDENFNEMGSGFRYDTDMMFRILESGWEIRTIKPLGFVHMHRYPKTKKEKIKYAISRIKIHRFDALLYRRHPELAKDFLNIKFGFIRSPLEDFRVATGLWGERKNLSLSSPQGVVLLRNKTPFHFILIILLGIVYVFLVKLARLYGSLIYKKLLI